MSTGVNLRNLHNIIFAFSTRSQVRVIQSIGRGLRIADNGQSTKLFDIIDNMEYGTKKNYVLLHAFKRIQFYNEEQFKFKLKEIQFEP